jgi:hypothetical protein
VEVIVTDMGEALTQHIRKFKPPVEYRFIGHVNGILFAINLSHLRGDEVCLVLDRQRRLTA